MVLALAGVRLCVRIRYVTQDWCMARRCRLEDKDAGVLSVFVDTGTAAQVPEYDFTTAFSSFCFASLYIRPDVSLGFGLQTGLLSTAGQKL